MNNIAKNHQKHLAGWDVFLDEQKLCSLEFLKYDPPFYSFKIFDTHGDDGTLEKMFKSASRDPIETLVYKNRANNIIVKDEYFVGWYEDGLVRLRDYRLAFNLPLWRKLLIRILNLLKSKPTRRSQ
jgi:hypothetical protein